MGRLLLLLLVLCSTSASAFQVFTWRRDWGSDTVTRETVARDADRKLLHSNTDDFVKNHSPAVSLHDFDYSSNGFENGIVAIRPLLSDATQACFITQTGGWRWWNAWKTVRNRQGTSLSRDTAEFYVLQRGLPSDLDPVAITTVNSFCGVERDFMLYMMPTADASKFRKVRIQGLFTRHVIGVPDSLESAVFGN